MLFHCVIALTRYVIHYVLSGNRNFSVIAVITSAADVSYEATTLTAACSGRSKYSDIDIDVTFTT